MYHVKKIHGRGHIKRLRSVRADSPSNEAVKISRLPVLIMLEKREGLTPSKLDGVPLPR